ncbi:GumC domain-containing protein [Aporhodopirellula aestuarii]|uniref:Polysaccharide chain length determinant N-terminal domain-containing protein n=1 Tax=Aporhodopirellula aestuarii TaxID=2950107 RepID=A0ABT0UDF2_9BACT|nr:hypothetical protein [Aporhodopirellula aestuarii]MCM2374822.1 hypothetical protein [Aporhodopirellula aestuarii]
MRNRSAPRSGLPEFSELVIACRHRPRRTLVFGCICSVGFTIAAWLMTTATYQSESYVRVRQREDVVLSAQTSRSEDLAYFRAQSQLALSPQVLAKALQDEDLQRVYTAPSVAEGVTWLRRLVSAETQAGAEILSISASHHSADVSYAASVAVTKAYLNEVTSRSIADRNRRRAELENAARAAERELGEQWAQLNKVASELGSSDTQALAMRDQVKMQAYRDYAQQLRAAQVRRNELQAMLSDEQTRVSEMESRPPITPLVQKTIPAPVQPIPSPQIASLQYRINVLDTKISEIRRIAAQPDTPRLAPLLEQRQDYVTQLSELTKAQENAEPSEASTNTNASLGQANLQGPVTDVADRLPANQLAQIQKRIELNESECQFLKERMAEIDSSVEGNQRRNGVDLEVARHSVDRQSKLADELWASLEELKIESQSQPRAVLMQLADFPLHANHSRRYKASVGAFGLGWLLVILVVGLSEYHSCLVRHSDAVTAISNHPVFGRDGEMNSPASGERYATSAASRETAARLMLLAPSERQIPSLLVTGATHNEPHENAALQIALAFAGYQRRTLLIDSDVTNERLGKRLGTESQPGLIQLAGAPDQTMRNVIQTCHPDLDYLPSGMNESTGTWIDPQTLQATLQVVRPYYDAIVIAGPALCSSGESLLVAAQAELIVLSAIVGLTRWSDLATCHEKLDSTGLSIAGTILLPASFGVQGTDVGIPQIRIGTPASLKRARSNESDIASPSVSATPSAMDEAEMQQNIAAMQDELQQVVANTKPPQPTPSPKPQSDSIL